MPSAIYLRLVGYGVTLGLHSFTFYDVLARLAVTTKDPVVADFATLQDKFITIWTFMLQIIYVILGLSCDILNLRSSSEKWELLKFLNGFRQTLFSALIWPLSFLIPAMFWPMYLYDNSLIFPPYIDKVLSWSNNHVMHTYVAFFAFWELLFLKRSKGRHKLNIALLTGLFVAYLVVLFNSFHDRGTFIYPFMDPLYGTLYFPVIFIFTGMLAVFFYYIQWPLSSLVWGTKKEKLGGKKRL